jgi:hypothetical protein
MTAFLQANNIRQILSTSYHPASNGKVERKNRQIRDKLKAGFIRGNANVWNAARLQEITDNINGQINVKSRMRGVDLYAAGYNPPAPLPPNVQLTNQSTPADLAIHNRHFLEYRAERQTHGALPTFRVGDFVRVYLFSLSSEYRRKIKAHDGTNKFVVHWSPVISVVVRVLPRNPTTRYRETYWIFVGGVDGLRPQPPFGAPLMRGAVPWEFAGNQLTLAGDRTSLDPRNIPHMDQINNRN